MNRASKKSKHYMKFFKFFLFAQMSTLVIAVVINVVILLPNNFKAQHKSYQACLDYYKNDPKQSKSTCVKPYTR
jgi:hypothetical protein